MIDGDRGIEFSKLIWGVSCRVSEKLMIETTQCSIQSKIKHQINRGFPNPSVSLFCRWNTAVAIWVETAPVNRSSLPSKCSYFRWAMDCLLYFSLSLSTTQKCSLTLSLSLSLSHAHFIEKLCMQKTFRLISCLKILLPPLSIYFRCTQFL